MKKTSKISTTIAAVIAVFFTTFAVNTSAHHSFSIFAIEHKIQLTGVLTDIRFISPHIKMEFEATREDGSKEEWEIESMAPFRWDRLGHDRDHIKVGDTATFFGFPARNCRNFMALSAIDTEEKGMMVVAAEIRQGSARESVPDVTDICDSWPEQ